MDPYPALVYATPNNVRDPAHAPLHPHPPPTATPADAAAHHWSPSHHSPPSSAAPTTPGSMYPAQTRVSDGFDYAAARFPPALPPPPPTHAHSPTGLPTPDSSMEMAQIESSAGPSRVLTRRQAKIAQLGRAGPGPGADPGYYNTTAPHLSRPGTPNSFHSNPYPSPAMLTMQPGAARSPYYPTSPSTASPYSPYNYFHTHSRSTSNSTSNHRSTSPALSQASAVTSMSSTSAPLSHKSWAGIPPLPAPMSLSAPSQRQKHRKQRLFNLDRKAICEYHRDNPNARQEDIAQRYGVERSTISKILKHKTKWLNVPENEELKVAKHRPSKFPEIEEEMLKWLEMMSETKQCITDASIRNEAKDVARRLEIPEDRFKASSGWVENFKHRHGIRRGLWNFMNGKNYRITRALGGGVLPDDLSSDDGRPLTPAVVSMGLAMYDLPDPRSSALSEQVKAIARENAEATGQASPGGSFHQWYTSAQSPTQPGPSSLEQPRPLRTSWQADSPETMSTSRISNERDARPSVQQDNSETHRPFHSRIMPPPSAASSHMSTSSQESAERTPQEPSWSAPSDPRPAPIQTWESTHDVHMGPPPQPSSCADYVTDSQPNQDVPPGVDGSSSISAGPLHDGHAVDDPASEIRIHTPPPLVDVVLEGDVPEGMLLQPIYEVVPTKISTPGQAEACLDGLMAYMDSHPAPFSHSERETLRLMKHKLVQVQTGITEFS